MREKFKEVEKKNKKNKASAFVAFIWQSTTC